MSWDPNPWAVENSRSSADIGRLIAWHATNGFTGIAKPTDLRVLAMASPTGQIRVSPGAAAIPCKALGKNLQSYVGQNPTEDYLAIPATGSGSGRSDLIVARVENPISGEPWTAPDDPLAGPYIFTRRYPNVANTTTSVTQVDAGASAITLARIDIPANTTAITNAMITDLRGKPASGEPPLVTTPYVAANQDFYDAIDFDRTTVVDNILPYTQQTYTTWPTAAAWTLTVPNLATEVVVKIDIHCEQRITPGQSATNNAYGNVWGDARLRIVGTGVDFSVDIEFDRDYYGGGTPTTVLIPVGGKVPIPVAARGKTLTFQCEAKMRNDANTKGRLFVTKGSFISTHIHFNVAPASA